MTARYQKAIVEELVIANHILAHLRILDGFGHVSVRDPDSVNHFLIAGAWLPLLWRSGTR